MITSLHWSVAHQHCAQPYCLPLVTVNIATFDLQSSSQRVTSAPTTNSATQIVNIVFLFCIFFLWYAAFKFTNSPLPSPPGLPLNALICSPVRADKKKRICNLLAFLQLPFQLHECYILVQCCIASVVVCRGFLIFFPFWFARWAQHAT